MDAPENVVDTEGSELANIVLEEECDDCPKEARYLAIYKTEEGCESHVFACTIPDLKKVLKDILFENIICVWKGKKKEIRKRSVIDL